MSKGVGTALGLIVAGVGGYFLVKNAVDLGLGRATCIGHNRDSTCTCACNEICTCACSIEVSTCDNEGGQEVITNECKIHTHQSYEFDLDMGVLEGQSSSDSHSETDTKDDLHDSALSSECNNSKAGTVLTRDTNVHTYDTHTTNQIGRLLAQDKPGTMEVATNEHALMASLVNSAASTHNHASIRKYGLVDKACAEILASDSVSEGDMTEDRERHVVRGKRSSASVDRRVNALAVIANMAVNVENSSEMQQAVGAVCALLEKVARELNGSCEFDEMETDSSILHTQNTTGIHTHANISIHTHKHAPTPPPQQEKLQVLVASEEESHGESATSKITYVPSDAEAVMALKAALNLSTCEEHHSALIACKVPDYVVKFMACDTLGGIFTPLVHKSTNKDTRAHTQSHARAKKESTNAGLAQAPLVISNGNAACHYTAERRAQAYRVAVNLSTSTDGALALVKAGVVPCLVSMLKLRRDDEELDMLRRLLVCTYNCVQAVISVHTDGQQREEATQIDTSAKAKSNNNVGESERGNSRVVLSGRDEVYDICRVLAKRANDDEHRAEKVLTLLVNVQDADL
ncbi:hypothetical protein SARC_08025 [Sphaeroforma arctica JP610]|uniref:Armadillo repeat-containing domain-containing protein n=1 Tax=Sphaeroforma arctica JP610 TaxID=667725 RepID=A0A0L0FS32_9EUKA|nr:hypothetical protein SARC_08025 [Sphaeroforma arctica JP610]KNC79592.1 hypothetical protein SARC_08025 [Sphaeroforma arctica JP610]|eukprot:XP_014153494.1 hypothetical protein SARC_08025 [Sphaeroforma arctica JP610]